MKKRNILIIMMLLPMMVSAFTGEAVVDGIKYYISTKHQTAEVRANNYSGDIVIPATIVYEDVVCSVTSIGNSAFYMRSGLTSITIPNSVTTIGNNAFWQCSGLTSVHISDIAAWCNITFSSESSNPLYYANHLYLGEEEITDLVIPNSVTTIGNYTFLSWSNLVSVIIPNSVTNIGDMAFYYCSGLTSVTIGNSVASIGSSAFSNCRNLTSITIPNSVTSIGIWAFSGSKRLTSVTIPNGVTNIAKGVFSSCTGLTSITIPNSVKSIGYKAFDNCTGLTTVTIPNSVNSIENQAFSSCKKLKYLTIGSGVTNILSQAFSSCAELLDVYCSAENVPSTNTDAFWNSDIGYTNLHVPFASIDAYKAAEPWKNFKQIVALNNEEIPETPKCDKPNIIKEGNKFWFECGTPGATFKSKITPNVEEQEFEGSEVVFKSGVITYTLTVYASAEGYEDSDPVNMTLTIDQCDVNQDGKVDVADIATIIDKMAGR